MSAAKDSSTNMLQVYVRLLNEGTDVFRPTSGTVAGKNLVQLLPTANYDATDEEWEFTPGAVVEYEQRTIEGKDVLVAIRRIR